MVWKLELTKDLTDQQFNSWHRLLEGRTGIQIAPHQRNYLQIQIARRMKELDLDDYDQYFEKVSEGLPGKVEWSILVDRLAVKESDFFRHRDSIDFVRQMLQQRIINSDLKDSFEVWSFGCATGEEPYSLAMTINDCFEHAHLEPYYGITATDISHSALKYARAGVFSERKLEGIDSKKRSRYFVAVGNREYQIVDKLRARVCFSQGNILQLNKMPDVKMDVIFCQNLLIYFRRWRRREILAQLAARLKPNGILLIGLGEVMDWSHPQLQRIKNERVQAYQFKPGEAVSAVENINKGMSGNGR